MRVDTNRDDLRDRLARVLHADFRAADAVLTELAPILRWAQYAQVAIDPVDMPPSRRALWDELAAWKSKSPEARS